MALAYHPNIFNRFPELIAVQSTRHGGISPPPYYALNLGLNTKDLAENVLENRRLFFEELSIEQDRLAYSYQVHEDRILLIDRPGAYTGYDALITQQAGIFLSVTIADCTPILIYDCKEKVVAAIHAGWRGTVAQIVYKTMLQMKAIYQCNPENCFVYIGTCIDQESFEVDAAVADKFESKFKKWDTQKEKFLVDLKAANQQQLLNAGCLAHQIELSPYSTVLDNHNYFSYRKEKPATGRMLALIGIRT